MKKNSIMNFAKGISILWNADKERQEGSSCLDMKTNGMTMLSKMNLSTLKRFKSFYLLRFNYLRITGFTILESKGHNKIQSLEEN